MEAPQPRHPRAPEASSVTETDLYARLCEAVAATCETSRQSPANARTWRRWLMSPVVPWVIFGVLIIFVAVDKLAKDIGLSTTDLLTFRGSAVERQLGGSGTASAGSSSGSSAGDVAHAGHKHDAMLFLFLMISAGTAITHLATHPKLHGMQQTVVLFVLGVSFSFFQEGLIDRTLNAKSYMGMLGRSYDMWMGIDPHLLLFTLLPALLAGDAMTIDTAIARRVAKQCCYLASIGVLINGFLTALFLWAYLPYNWSFLLSLTVGSILCATDPVAVVALLKELGAPPTLTVQIQGESLLNDGTAIVLYSLSYNALKGETYDASDIIVFLVKTAVCAWGLGLAIGYIFYTWIAATHNKLEEHSSMVQIALTLACAYWSFILAEGVLEMSGVLSTVAASLVLADKMWPVITSKESMHTVWHVFEYLGNSVIFFLAGSLTGKVTVRIPWGDYGHVLVIYVVTTLIRFGMLLVSKPILNYFGKEFNQSVTVADTMVMTWGGLRGAVGLALAIQVSIDRAGGELGQLDADRVLFFVGGIAALTLMINATTAPLLVRWLGVANLPETKQRILLMMHDELFKRLADKTKANKHLQDSGKLLELEMVMNHMEDRILADVNINNAAEEQVAPYMPKDEQVEQTSEDDEQVQQSRPGLHRSESFASKMMDKMNKVTDRTSQHGGVNRLLPKSMSSNNLGMLSPIPSPRMSTHSCVSTHSSGEQSAPAGAFCRLQRLMNEDTTAPEEEDGGKERRSHTPMVRKLARSASAVSMQTTDAAKKLGRGDSFAAGTSTSFVGVGSSSTFNLASYLGKTPRKSSIDESENESDNDSDTGGAKDEVPEWSISRVSAKCHDKAKPARTSEQKNNTRRSMRSSTTGCLPEGQKRASLMAQLFGPRTFQAGPELFTVAKDNSDDEEVTSNNDDQEAETLQADVRRRDDKLDTIQSEMGVEAEVEDIASGTAGSRTSSKKSEGSSSSKERRASADSTSSWTDKLPAAIRHKMEAAKRAKTCDDATSVIPDAGQGGSSGSEAPPGSLVNPPTRSSQGNTLVTPVGVQDIRGSISSDGGGEPIYASAMGSSSFNESSSVNSTGDKSVNGASIRSSSQSRPSQKDDSQTRLSQKDDLRASQKDGSRTSRTSTRSKLHRKGSMRSVASTMSKMSMKDRVWSGVETIRSSLRNTVEIEMSPAKKLLNEVADLRKRVNAVPRRYIELLGHIPPMVEHEKDEAVRDLMISDEVDAAMLWATNEALLNLVYGNYWDLIENGDVIPGTSEAEICLTSVKLALSNCRGNLSDIKYIKLFVHMPFDSNNGVMDLSIGDDGLVQLEEGSLKKSDDTIVNKIDDKIVPAESVAFKADAAASDGAAARLQPVPSYVKPLNIHQVPELIPGVRPLVQSTPFNAVVMAAIVGCSIWWVVEEQLRKEDSKYIIWLIADIVFTSIFFIEFILRFMDLRCSYFREALNVFDFVLVVIGVFSVTVNALEYFAEAMSIADAGLSRSGVLRIARVVRVVRLMRIGRLFRFWQVIKAHMMNKELSLEVAERVQKITILVAFVKAHAMGQHKASEYFGKKCVHEVVELAHSVLQSQASCFRALLLAVRVQSQLNEDMIREVNDMKLRKKVAEDLQGFVLEAHHVGIITAKEADGMLHPLKDMIKICNGKIRDSHFGLVKNVRSCEPGDPEDLPDSVTSSAGDDEELGCIVPAPTPMLA